MYCISLNQEKNETYKLNYKKYIPGPQLLPVVGEGRFVEITV
jgi:hypothetical protein